MERLTRLVVAAIVVAVTLLGAPSALATELHCSDHEEGELRGNLIVPSGETCDLEDAEVFGNVVVEPNGALILRDSRIRGNIQATGFDRVDFRAGSEVHGNVTLQDGGTFEAGDADVFGNFEARGNAGDGSRMGESR